MSHTDTVIAGCALLWGSPILFFAFLVCHAWREERKLAENPDPSATRDHSQGSPPSPPLRVAATPSTNEERSVA